MRYAPIPNPSPVPGGGSFAMLLKFLQAYTIQPDAGAVGAPRGVLGKALFSARRPKSTSLSASLGG
jgi:hypothetical protein